MGKHTPGPWVLEKDGWISSESEAICLISHAGPENFSTEEMENAKLICAAPELLEALAYARRFLNERDHDTAFVDAAIAKARGEA